MALPKLSFLNEIDSIPFSTPAKCHTPSDTRIACSARCQESALHPLHERAKDLAQTIMRQVMKYRRMANPKKTCATSTCEACLASHLPHVIHAIIKKQPITFVLPAFPAKSPNLAKVLGTLPDMAERLALTFLNDLCKKIQTIYSPGARVLLCADGRVFNDVVGIRDADVTDYQRELAWLIKKFDFTFISTFNLDDIYPNLQFDRMRNTLMASYGEPLETLKIAVRKGSRTPCRKEHEEVNRQYCGITRFLVEDGMHRDQSHSRNQVQKACRERAYIVIQRSRAWSDLIAERYPHAVRLSIHPQTCGASKLGIRLMEAETWMTPWHGVALEVRGRFVLLKRTQAESLSAKLVYRENRPSHYELTNEQQISKLQGVLYGT